MLIPVVPSDARISAHASMAAILAPSGDLCSKYTPSLQERKNMKTFKRYFTIIICLVYIISPIDIIPEAVLGPLGLVDDGAVLIKLIMTLLIKEK